MVADKDDFDQVIHDTRLDWHELGILLYLLTRGERFTMPMRELYRLRPTGRERVDRGVQRLEELGYVARSHERSGGRYIATRWVVRALRP